MKSYFLVGVQFCTLGFLAWYGGIPGGVFSSGLFFCGLVIGFLAVHAMHFRVSIFPEVRPEQELFIGSVYRYIRHPMYTAVLLIASAWVLNRPDGVSIAVWGVLFVDLLLKISFEEKELLKRFHSYEEYMGKTKKLIPWVF